MLRTRLPWMISFAVCGVFAAATSSADYRWLVDSAVGKFDKKDWEMLKTTLGEVLQDEKGTEAKTWENPASGHSGKITVVKNYQSDDGKPCKLLRFNNNAGGYTGSSRYDVCRAPNGDWLEASSGAPFSLATR